MGIKTAIEYCDSTINPIMGCTGCELYHPNPSKNHCYAATLINRYKGCKGWPKHFNLPEHFPGRLEKAIKWSDLTGKQRPNKPWLNGRPRVIFINDLSDGFCPSASPERWLAPRLESMAESPHIWLLLTKWPKKMRLFCELHPPPENVWPGVTVLRQKDVWRIEELLQIQASMWWLSLEPLLGAVVLDKRNFVADETYWDYLQGKRGTTCQHFALRPQYTPSLSWVVGGGESGPSARPMHPRWARDIRDQCLAASVPYFHKQNGMYILSDGYNQWGTWLNGEFVEPSRIQIVPHRPDLPFQPHMVRVGKKRAGHLLDGREWREFPE